MLTTHAQSEGEGLMTHAGIHNNTATHHIQPVNGIEQTAPQITEQTDHTLTLTGYYTLEESVERLQALHAGDIDSPTRTRVILSPESEDRIGFTIHHIRGHLDHSVMRGTLAHRGAYTLVSAHIEREAQRLWLIALAVAALLGVLLLIQVNLPMLLMIGALPLFVIRDNFTERRGAIRLMRLIRQTFEQ